MSKLKVNRIKAYLERTFEGKIDISDLSSKTSEEQHKHFLSRALASYALMINVGIGVEDAAGALTDGFDDNGIDLIYFDQTSSNLWLVQSKLINNGSGGLDNGDVEKFTKGVKLLIDGDFERFNRKIQSIQGEILEALENPSVKIQILFAYTGSGLSSHNQNSIKDLLDEQNDTDEVVVFTDFDLNKAYKGLETGVGSAPINEDVFIYDWGHIEEPSKSYYGQVSGWDLSVWWTKYGHRLFTENIRSFLGSSGANDEITKTIKTEAQNFIYFNNGITVLCESIKKKPIGGNDRNVGAFSCYGLSVVNGAQTLGSIGSLAETHAGELEKVRVLVKFISLENSPAGFGQRITIATNTQNKVERKDFVSLDSEQAKLKLELKLEGIDYHYKRTDEKIVPDSNNYLLEEVAYSLASFWPHVDYSTTVKKESNKIWEDVTKPQYTDLFNPELTAQKVIKTVRVYRFVSQVLEDMASDSEGRERSIYRYANSLVSHIVFQKIPKQVFTDNYMDFEKFCSDELDKIVDEVIESLYENIENEYPESMIVYVLRNYTKCRHLKSLMLPGVS